MSIGISIEKAKEIHKNHIRQVRTPLLEQKDIEYMRALEEGDSTKATEVSTEKQALRDVTSIVDDVVPTSTDVIEVTEQLKQVWDENLLGPNPLV